MGKKSRKKREGREAQQSQNPTGKESETMEDNKSPAISIKGGRNNRADHNLFIGVEQAIEIVDSPGSTANRNIVIGKESVNVFELNSFIKTLRANIEQLELPEGSAKKILSDIEPIEAQAKSPRPKSSIIIPCLRSVKRVLENAASSAIAVSLVATSQLYSF